MSSDPAAFRAVVVTLALLSPPVSAGAHIN